MSHEGAQIQYCDIVMKGGLTSGVVYPLAIKEGALEPPQALVIRPKI